MASVGDDDILAQILQDDDDDQLLHRRSVGKPAKAIFSTSASTTAYYAAPSREYDASAPAPAMSASESARPSSATQTVLKRVAEPRATSNSPQYYEGAERREYAPLTNTVEGTSSSIKSSGSALGKRRREEQEQPAVETLEASAATIAELSKLSCNALGERLASLLSETNVESLKLACGVLGTSAAVQLFVDTVDTEGKGGLFTAEGNRRRTPGGVFFALLKSRVSPEQWKDIFRHVTMSHRAAVGARRKRDAAYASIMLGHAPPQHLYAGFERGGGGGGGDYGDEQCSSTRRDTRHNEGK